jgi:hypothetical protein
MAERQFWRLAKPHSTARYAEWARGEMDLEQVICPVNPGHRRGGKRLTNLSVVLPGRTVEDFVWTWQTECLVQDHLLELFRKSGFTGFDVKPVKAAFKRASEQEPPRLWELIVTGWAGIASAESGVNLVERCNTCGSLRYSGCSNVEKLIDASQWDGSDFFMVWPLPKFIFITDRVARVIRENRLAGVTIQRFADLRFASGSFSPGRLSYWMPEDRARELGGTLGID